MAAAVNSQEDRNSLLEPAAAAELCRELKGLLDKKKQTIFEEIKHYPRPIAACDQQFNHLLEQRMTILQELSRLQELTDKQRLSFDLLDEFMRTSGCLGEGSTKLRLTSARKNEPDALWS
jgi:hypothetical protein